MTEMDVSIEPLFSTPLARFETKNFINTFVDLDLNKEKDEQWYQNPKQHNVWNHKSHDILAEDGFEELSNLVHQAVEEYFYNILRFSRDIRPVRTSSWLTIGDHGSVTAEHLHINSLYSGVIYLKSIPGSGDLYFVASDNGNYSTTTIKPIPVDFNIFNSSIHTVRPNSGDIFVFPSHLVHGVTENISKEPRCALAFNYFVEGLVSDVHTNYLYLNYEDRNNHRPAP